MAANRPTAAELLEAAREFLEGEAMDAIAADNVKFKLRVAVNVLRLIERELLCGPGNDTRELSRLQALLDRADADLEHLNAELCERIRTGEFDDRLQQLLPSLQQSTLDKLAIDNPRYSTYVALRGRE